MLLKLLPDCLACKDDVLSWALYLDRMISEHGEPSEQVRVCRSILDSIAYRPRMHLLAVRSVEDLYPIRALQDVMPIPGGWHRSDLAYRIVWVRREFGREVVGTGNETGPLRQPYQTPKNEWERALSVSLSRETWVSDRIRLSWLWAHSIRCSGVGMVWRPKSAGPTILIPPFNMAEFQGTKGAKS